MERVLTGLHWSTCLVYIDNIILFSARTISEPDGGVPEAEASRSKVEAKEMSSVPE